MKRAVCIIGLLALCLAPGLSLAGTALNITYNGSQGSEVAGFGGRIFDGSYPNSRTYNIDRKGVRKITVQLGDPAGGGDSYELHVLQLQVVFFAGTKWGQIQYRSIGVTNQGPCNWKIKPESGRIDMELYGSGNPLSCKVITGKVTRPY